MRLSLFKHRLPFYQYAQATQMPTPGAMQYGFESEMLAFRAMIGPAIGQRSQWASLLFYGQHQQNYQGAAMAWFTGVGGLAHGQNVLQPLSNPYAG